MPARRSAKAAPFAKGEISKRAWHEADVARLAAGTIASLKIPKPKYNSITWCKSRFVCVTMKCTGSSWC